MIYFPNFSGRQSRSKSPNWPPSYSFRPLSTRSLPWAHYSTWLSATSPTTQLKMHFDPRQEWPTPSPSYEQTRLATLQPHRLRFSRCLSRHSFATHNWPLRQRFVRANIPITTYLVVSLGLFVSSTMTLSNRRWRLGYVISRVLQFRFW